MKIFYILLGALALAFICLNITFANDIHNNPKTDTIMINFGNRSKIIIYVANKNDFEQLKKYDLNAMLKDLSISIDSTQEDVQVLQIKDSTGTRYLSDTTVVLSTSKTPEEYKEVVVVEEDTAKDVTLRIGKYSIKIHESEKNITIEKDKKPRRTSHSYNIDLGMNNYVNNGKFPDETDELYTVRPLGSWYIALSSIRKTHVSGPLFFEWGGNVSWYNFKFQNNHTRFTKEDGSLLFYEADPSVRAIKSKLSASYLNMSAVPMLDFSKRNKDEDHSYSGRGFRMGAGGYVGYRIGSKSKYVYEEGGKEKDKFRDNYYLNNFRYGVRMQMGYRGLDLFINYDLNELFIANKGPQLNAFSFGITL